MTQKAHKAIPATAKSKERYKHKTPSLLKDPGKKSSRIKDAGHLALDILGMLPVVGNFADAANAGWYFSEGDHKNAAFSTAAAIPGAGLGVGLAKLGLSGTKVAKGALATQKAITKSKVAKTIKNNKSLKKVDNWAKNTKLGRVTEGLANFGINTRKPLKTGRQFRMYGEAFEQSGANDKINEYIDNME